MVYFGVFFVLPNSVRFPAFYAEIPAFYADILSLSSYLRMPSLSVIRRWCARVVRSRRWVGCEVGQENK